MFCLLAFVTDTCKCHEFGANGRLCDPLSFQCDCKLGVVGRTCDKCKLGWWGIRLINTQNNEGCLRKCYLNTRRCIKNLTNSVIAWKAG